MMMTDEPQWIAGSRWSDDVGREFWLTGSNIHSSAIRTLADTLQSEKYPGMTYCYGLYVFHWKIH